jgi:hypothetical protein
MQSSYVSLSLQRTRGAKLPVTRFSVWYYRAYLYRQWAPDVEGVVFNNTWLHRQYYNDVYLERSVSKSGGRPSNLGQRFN